MYANVVRNLLYPLDLMRSGELARRRYFRELISTQYLSRDDMAALQLRRVQALVTHAWHTCPFYRRVLDKAGVIPSDIRTLADMKHIPVLAKRDIQESRDEMASSAVNRSSLQPNQTGGSTGEPVSFFVTRDGYARRAAATLRHNGWAGWQIGNKVAALWGAPQDRAANTPKQWIRNKLIDRMLLLDTANLSPEVFRSFDRQLKTFRPDHILAYAKSMALFCEFLQRERITPFQPRSIVTSAEMLSDRDRQLIEATFGCRVYNRYGCREVSVIASDCEHHTGMHVCAEHLLVEIEPWDGLPAGPGNSGRVLITDLTNYGMPLIRYRIGDIATMDDRTCPCGRGLPLLTDISGRITDFLVVQTAGWYQGSSSRLT